MTALIVAENAGDEHIQKIIKDFIQEKDVYVTQDEMFPAIEKNDLKTIEKLVQEGYSVNAKAKETIGSALKGITPLLYASRLGRLGIVEFLLANGANPKIVDWTMKSTVLHKAGYMGHAHIIAVLVEYGAEINAQGPYNGYTALHDAVWHDHTEAVKALIKSGAELGLKGLDGNSPLDLAKAYNYKDIQDILTKAKTDEN